MAATRKTFPDGRIVLANEVQVSGGESPVLDVDGADVRPALDLFINPNGHDNANRMLVRVYAVVGATKVEVARGRIRMLGDPANYEGAPSILVPHQVIGARGLSASGLSISVQADGANQLPPPGTPRSGVIYTAVLHHATARLNAVPLTVLTRVFGITYAMTALPSLLYSVIAHAGNATGDRWLMLFDRATPPVNGNVPNLPGLYVSQGAKGISSLDFDDDRPMVFNTGIYSAWSTTPRTFTAAPDGGEAMLEYT